jgi:hypothetical protein
MLFNLILATGLCAGLAMAQNPGPPSAIPGTLNYLEGSASIDGRTVAPGSVGSVRLQQNQVLETSQGRAEVLLTPGVFLRLNNNTAVRMLSPDLTNTAVEVVRGEAMVEVAELFKENNLRVMVTGTSTLLAKPGLYSFNADQPQIAVYEGEAIVTAADHQVKVTKDHEAPLVGVVKARKFDHNRPHDALYAWSSLRSQYVAEASMQSARTLVAAGPGWGYGAGWYWNPWWDMYGFVPGYGVFYSPFGYPFYSPGFVFAAPYYGFRHGVVGYVGASRAFGASRGFAASAHFSGGGFAGGRAGGGGRR